MIELETIRVRSGSVRDTSKLVAFLYTLMCDHVTPGTVEKILKDTQTTIPTFQVGGDGGGDGDDGDDEMEYEFSNGWLASHAKDVAHRLTK